MHERRRHPIWSWVIHTPWVLAVLGVLGVVSFFGSGSGNPLLERLLVSRLDRATGGKAELRSMSIRWLALRVTIRGFVIHRHEAAGNAELRSVSFRGLPLPVPTRALVIPENDPAGTEPLFTAGEVQAALRIDS